MVQSACGVRDRVVIKQVDVLVGFFEVNSEKCARSVLDTIEVVATVNNERDGHQVFGEDDLFRDSVVIRITLRVISSFSSAVGAHSCLEGIVMFREGAVEVDVSLKLLDHACRHVLVADVGLDLEA